MLRQPGEPDAGIPSLTAAAPAVQTLRNRSPAAAKPHILFQTLILLPFPVG